MIKNQWANLDKKVELRVIFGEKKNDWGGFWVDFADRECWIFELF